MLLLVFKNVFLQIVVIANFRDPFGSKPKLVINKNVIFTINFIILLAIVYENNFEHVGNEEK